MLTYIDYTLDMLNKNDFGEPIYTKQIAEALAKKFGLGKKEASAATAVAVKRIMQLKSMAELRYYSKGIYYRTKQTPFGEMNINKQSLIVDKYINPNKGYETGLSLLHHMGLTTQMPKERVIATNAAKECARTDKELGVIIRPPKIEVNEKNKAYLQVLDVLEVMNKAPVDTEKPYELLARHIDRCGLEYAVLLSLADKYYTKSTVIQLAHTAGKGEKSI